MVNTMARDFFLLGLSQLVFIDDTNHLTEPAVITQVEVHRKAGQVEIFFFYLFLRRR